MDFLSLNPLRRTLGWDEFDEELRFRDDNSWDVLLCVDAADTEEKESQEDLRENVVDNEDRLL